MRRFSMTEEECLWMANILRFYLRNTPPRVAPKQRALAENILGRLRNG